MTSSLLALPGAVPPPEDSPDPGIAWHYGDPLGEQRAAERGAAVVDRSNREIIAVPGEDRLTWLHTITSQHLLALGDGEHTEALVLDLRGHVEHHAVVSHVDGTVWLDTDPGAAQGLLGYLNSMVFWSKVTPREATTERAVLSLLGPGAEQVRAQAGELGGFVRVATGRTDLMVPRDELRQAWQRLIDAGATPAGTWAYEALRVAALRPRLGIDTDERTIPHEVGWIGPAVHLDKGCYRGQETVARVANLGRPPRRMVLLHLESPEQAPSTGDPVRAGERVVGRVGTVAIHHELGPIALALLKRSIEPGTPLQAGRAAASIDPACLPPDTGEPPGRAAVRRLKG
ncbi:MAG TPA: folate-binding protein YgfZ [Pseudonocardiaceae bacterium]|nr:folate-binding protein YgfZ [Pseudonocardiaceae bacterium]